MDAPLRVDNIERSMDRTYAWIQRVRDELDDAVTPKQAYGILRGLLQVLRDRLPVAQAANFAAQLPEFLRGVYYEGWEPAQVPLKFDAEEFQQRFLKAASLPQGMEAKDGLRAGIRAVQTEMADGEIRKVFDALPDAVRTLLAEE